MIESLNYEFLVGKKNRTNMQISKKSKLYKKCFILKLNTSFIDIYI